MNLQLKKREGWLCIAIALLWCIGCFAFFQLKYPYHFFYKEQQQLFLLSSDYIGSYITNGSGWLSRLVGDFLTQFNYYLYVGALLLTLVLAAMGAVAYKVLRNCRLPQVWAMVGSLCVMTLEAWMHLSYKYTLSSTIGHIGLLLMLWALVVWLRLMRGPLTQRLLPRIALPVCVALGFWLFGLPEWGRLNKPEWELEYILGLDNEYHWGNYAKVSSMAAGSEYQGDLTDFYYNLANAQLGCMPDKLVLSPQTQLGTEWQIGPETPLLYIDQMHALYFALGDMTFTERAAQMAMVFSSTNRNVRMVQRLAEANLVNGDTVAATKYMRLLDKTLCHSAWLTPSRQEMLRQKQAYVNTQDTIRVGDHYHAILTELLHSNRSNRIALDYLLCTDLLQYNITMFKADYDEFCCDDEGNVLPATKSLYQQALMIWLSANGADNETWHQYISDGNLVERFRNYMAVRGNAQQMHQFADTYWYFFDKRDESKK